MTAEVEMESGRQGVLKPSSLNKFTCKKNKWKLYSPNLICSQTFPMTDAGLATSDRGQKGQQSLEPRPFKRFIDWVVCHSLGSSSLAGSMPRWLPNQGSLAVLRLWSRTVFLNLWFLYLWVVSPQAPAVYQLDQQHTITRSGRSPSLVSKAWKALSSFLSLLPVFAALHLPSQSRNNWRKHHCLLF